MTVLKDIHGKSRYWCCFFISSVHYCYAQLFEGSVGLALILMSKKLHRKHAHHFTRVPLPSWCLPTRSPTHYKSTKGSPVFSGGHIGHSFFLRFLSFVHYQTVFQCPPTHPLSSGRASRGFGYIVGNSSGDPTQLISSERVTAGKSSR